MRFEALAAGAHLVARGWPARGAPALPGVRDARQRDGGGIRDEALAGTRGAPACRAVGDGGRARGRRRSARRPHLDPIAGLAATTTAWGRGGCVTPRRLRAPNAASNHRPRANTKSRGPAPTDPPRDQTTHR